MWALIYKEDYNDHKAGELHLIGRGKFVPSNHKMAILTHIEVPDQDIGHLYDDDGLLPGKKLSDLKQYTAEEKSKLPSAALAALKLRGPATNESMPGLSERVGLIERILGIEAE